MWDLILWSVGSVVMAQELSCPTACGILVLQSGIEPAFPALQGRFLTIGQPGNSREQSFKGKGQMYFELGRWGEEADDPRLVVPSALKV